MRHLRSIFYALVLAPCIWVLLAVGFTDDLSSRGREFFTAESVSGLLLLIFSGILFSILAAGPVSPAGPVLAGVVYLGVTIWAFNAPAAYAALWSPEISKEGFDLSRPGYGLAAVLAVPLLGTALSARRWARYEPPVLPIIGEIGRFRGAAKVAGTTVAAEQTTVIRTGVPADPTVAINHPGAADRTVAISNGRPTDRTEVVANNDRTVFVTQPQSPAAPVAPAPKAVPASRAPESEPTTVLPIGSGQPTVVRSTGIAAGDEPTVVSGLGLARATPAAAAAPPAKPAAATAAVPAKPAAATAAVPAKPAAVAPKPAVEKDAATVGLTDADPTTPLLIPAKAPAATATKPAEEPTTLITQPAEEPTALVTPPSDKTEPLKLPAEPTAVIPAQRRPPEIES